MKTCISPIMEKIIPFDSNDIISKSSVKLKSGKTLKDFCLEHLPNYNPEHYEALAIKFYAGKEISLTIFASIKLLKKQIRSTCQLPIKKFKIQRLPLAVLLDYFEEFNFTICKADYDNVDTKIIKN
ncbi:MAG: hypothetical protein ABI315_13225 [Bacteroidia bacterium]